jgi:hypothetical protein
MNTRRRLETIQRHLVTSISLPCASVGDDGLLFDFFSAGSIPSIASVGKIAVPLVKPAVPELVPFGIAKQISFSRLGFLGFFFFFFFPLVQLVSQRQCA